MIMTPVYSVYSVMVLGLVGPIKKLLVSYRYELCSGTRFGHLSLLNGAALLAEAL